MKCIKCSGYTKKGESERVFHGKITGRVWVEKCQKCGEEYVSEQEYEKARAKIGQIKAKAAQLLQKNVF